jgi:hypothetical protein
MEHKPALYALIDLHAELGGKIADNKRQAPKLRSDMKHVEATIKLLDLWTRRSACAGYRSDAATIRTRCSSAGPSSGPVWR